MTEEEIAKSVVTVISERLGFREANIKSTSALRDDLGADSLDFVELIMALEDEFDIEIPDDETTELVLVSNVIDYVKTKV